MPPRPHGGSVRSASGTARASTVTAPRPWPTWPETAINISHDEFDEAYDHVQQSGLPMKTDKTKAWQTFAQHRVQYECALMTLIRLKKPPRGARWTTDREEATKPLSIPVFGSRQATRQPPTTGANITGSRSG